MTVREQTFDLARFFRHVRQERHRLLMLDYEGVLAPLLAADPDTEQPSSLHALLNTFLLARLTLVVVVSELPAAEVPRHDSS
jgi:hypothetical protein